MTDHRWEPSHGDLQALRRYAEELRSKKRSAGHNAESTRSVPDLIDDLATHQEELRLQNEELKKAYDELDEAHVELRRINELLEEANDDWRSLYDFAPVGYATLDRRLRVVDANLRLAEFLGRERDSILGKRFAELVAPEDQDDLHRNTRRLVDGDDPKVQGFDLRLRRRTDSVLWVRADWIAIERPGHERVFRVTMADVSEHKATQAQLAQADRMASVGLLAAGIAHEINNPLMYVLYNTQSLAEDLSIFRGRKAKEPTTIHPTDVSDMADRADSAVDGARRIRDIVKGLRVFSHADQGQAAPTSISEVIDTAINMAFNEFKYRARLVKRCEAVPKITANAGQLCQVLLNLLVNAAQAIPEGDIEGNEIRIAVHEASDHIVIEVTDTGHGIPEADIPRIFEPFFTSKDVGVGSGLGLSISQKIVHGHGGHMSVTSTVGKGTSFVIRLPTDRVTTETIGTSKSELRKTDIVTGRILVIDDEAPLAEVVKRMLEDHDVVAVSSGLEGKKLIEDGEPFDVILCDLMMPGYTGMDFFSWLSTEHPSLVEQVIFMTGGVFTPRARSLLKQVSNLRLEKPFDPQNLSTAVQKLILARRATDLSVRKERSRK
jgi:PAS domain S-box-containing protein